MLTKKQIELVKATVPVLREHGVALTSHFYKRMLSLNPELRQVFNMGHQRAGFQQQALAGAVLAYAENIENLQPLLGAVAHIANKHVSVGIRAEHYPIVGKHLIASIKEVLGEAATDELLDAWAAAYSQLADILIETEKSIYDKNAVAEGGWTGWRFFKVSEKSRQTDDVTSFKLVPIDHGKMPKIKAGQYISVRVFVKGQELVQPRQYTVVNTDSTSLTIAVKKIEADEKSPAGMVSNTLHNQINEGDVVEVSFPVGEFNLPAGNGKLCLLSAGIGITPLFAMLKEAVRKDPTRKIFFIHVCKSKEAIPFSGEIDLLVKEGAVTFEVFETSVHGRPSEDFFKNIAEKNTDYCVCGPVSFMKLAAAELVKNGVSENKIHAEKFGTGAI